MLERYTLQELCHSDSLACDFTTSHKLAGTSEAFSDEMELEDGNEYCVSQ